ncbi:MAG TPA: VOC family protein [Phenylobacterium sp.]|uniref:VOC family protein n=1 Tax=Phenylobacterium sp. TaxID=1871053 RepID=UPI002D006D92|nr:VOC family protein [Phenylobacterium sp.]HSV03680.1 VOC family protein [Phenylobacterium sp.]
MLDHVSLKVADYARAQAFYDAALRPLGFSRQMGDGAHFAGYGVPGRPFFWIGQGDGGPAHVAFAAPDRQAVKAFHAAALAAGAGDNGAPGLRPQYHPGYYAAFVIDPDGNNIEAVCHEPG